MVKDISRLLELSSKNSICSKCKFLDRKFVPISYPKFSTENIVMVIGEAPGWEEAKEGVPFVGKSGQLLRDNLKEVGFDANKIIFSNVCKCHPVDNETPTDAEIDLCVPNYLEKEIKLFNPQLIIAVGSIACKGLGLNEKITNIRGQILSLDSGITVVPTYHPAYILRNYAHISVFKSDLRKAYNLLFTSSTFKESDCCIVSDLNGLGKFEEFYRNCRSSKSIVSVDNETNNTLDPLSVGSSLVCVGTSDGDRNFSIFLNHTDITDLKYRNYALELLKRYMSDRAIGKVGQNFVFDLLFQ